MCELTSINARYLWSSLTSHPSGTIPTGDGLNLCVAVIAEIAVLVDAASEQIVHQASLDPPVLAICASVCSMARSTVERISAMKACSIYVGTRTGRDFRILVLIELRVDPTDAPVMKS